LKKVPSAHSRDARRGLVKNNLKKKEEEEEQSGIAGSG
jgi:hypothetical protein